MKKPSRKRIIAVVLTLAVLAAFVIFDPDLQNIDDILTRIDPLWFLGALGCMVVYYLGDTGMYLIACRLMGAPQKLGEGLLTTMIGFFYSAITPLASGGQPFQIIQMKQRGINVGTSTSVLMLKFLSWHIVITLMGVIGAVALSSSLATGGTTMLVLFIVGVLVHIACVTAGIMLLLKPSFVQKLGNGAIGLVSKIKYFRKRPEKVVSMYASFDKFVCDYREAMQFALKHSWGMLFILLTGIVEVAAYMAVTYFVYRGLGFGEYGFLNIVTTQIILSISVAFIPLPGASIASEGGFFALFSQFFGAARSVGMLIWRVLTYYMTIFLGLAAVLIDGFRASKKKPGEAPSVTPDDSSL